MKKRMYLNAFEMNCVGHQSPGLWTHPNDQSSRYKEANYWIELAQILEKYEYDAVFLADVLGVYDVYGGDDKTSLKEATQVPVNDPMFVIPLMAHVTKHLGFGVTASVTHEHPYLFARKMTTLDHLTEGRIGWNIVTSYLASAALNMGKDQPLRHEERYAIAEEFVQVCYKLWEGSWEDGAVVRDRKSRTFTHGERVHPIEHKGKYFEVPGIHLCEPSAQRTPVLFQAGASPSGRSFATKHAELIFIGAPTIQAAKVFTSRIREETVINGRDPNDVKIITMITPIVAETTEEAQAKYDEYVAHSSYEGALALFGGWTGVDLSSFDPDDEVQYVENDAIRSTLESFTTIDPTRKWTIREIAHSIGIGGMGTAIVGTKEEVADELERWMDEADVDGFNLAYALAHDTFEQFGREVIPILKERGRRGKRVEGSFRHQAFGKGDDLPPYHPAKHYYNRIHTVKTN